jgi:hypothetical protein
MPSKCQFDGCHTRPTFNNPDQTRGMFCSEHKETGMVDIVNKKCQFDGCNTRPNYNKPGEKSGMLCFKHKQTDMIDVVNTKCQFETCNTRPNYNFLNQKGGIFCVKHKKKDMVDVVSKDCQFNGCSCRPNYNFPDQKGGIFCVKHKKMGMIDVFSKRCQFNGCSTQPKYNFPNQKCGIFCMKHKKTDMVNVVHKRCQATTGCLTMASCNIPGEKKAIFCAKHKKTDMVNIISKRCLTNLCGTIVSNKKYRGYCLRCFIYTHPNESVSRNYKTKEQTVVDHVKTKFPSVTWISDKRVSDGCSRYRPDLLLDMGYHVIIVEVDEHAHADYDCACENKRIMLISQDLGHRPIVIIRFNPDSYIDEKGLKIQSCWTTNKLGVHVVAKKHAQKWTRRLETLSDQIGYWVANQSDKLVEIINLFY